MGHLPGVLAEIAGVAGDEAAIAIAAARGGTRVYIPARVLDDHWLVTVAGRDAADAICKHFAVGDGRQRGSMIELPLGPTGVWRDARRRLGKAVADGASAAEAARLAGMSERTAWRARARIRDRKNSDQGDLF